MDFRKSREYIRMVASNMFVSMLPAPLGAIISTIEDINSEEDLEGKFDELKNNISVLKGSMDDQKTTVQCNPISIDVRLVNTVILYFNIIQTSDEANELEEEIYAYKREENLAIDSIFVEPEFVALNLPLPAEKDDELEYEVIQPIQAILEDYNIKVKAVAYM